MIIRAVIFANGIAGDYGILSTILREGDTLIAADGGAKHLRKMGLVPEVLIGDLDSIPLREVKRLEALGTKVFRFPVEKNETDLELALDYALDQKYTEIMILAPFGGRLDQTLGNITLLMRPDLKGIDIRMDDGHEALILIRDQATLEGTPGDPISLLPVGGDVKGVTTKGLLFPLTGETLFLQKTRGISNRMITESVKIRVKEGSLLCIHTRQRI